MNPITIRILALVAGLFTLAILPSAASAGDWGAIALSTRTGAWGTARNYDDEDGARARAMSECRKHASDCRVYKTFENTCVALAGDRTGNFGWSWGYTNNERRRRAIAQCRDQGGQNCTVENTFCTGDAD
jgi:hypothetical protein